MHKPKQTYLKTLTGNTKLTLSGTTNCSLYKDQHTSVSQYKLKPNLNNMPPLTSTSKTQEATIKELLDIYDLKSNNWIDVFFIPDIFYAIGKNPIKIEIETEFGQANKEGIKYVTKRLALRKVSKILQLERTKLKNSRRSNKSQAKAENINKVKDLFSLDSNSEAFNEDQYRDYLLELPYSNN